MLNPGGRIIILENIIGVKISRTADYISRLYGIIFYHFLGGRNYGQSEIDSLLQSCGFARITRKRLYAYGFCLTTAYRV